jgi:hypothetical protein
LQRKKKLFGEKTKMPKPPKKKRSWMNSKSDMLKDSRQETMATCAILTRLWDEKCPSHDWNWFIHWEDLEMVYGGGDKAFYPIPQVPG